LACHPLFLLVGNFPNTQEQIAARFCPIVNNINDPSKNTLVMPNEKIRVHRWLDCHSSHQHLVLV
jgi:hypothetical protein